MCSLPLRLQFGVRAFVDNDSPFHARYATEFVSRIFARTFPTTAYSIWAKQWGDKEFLFHAYLAPFCLSESLLQTGAKLASALLFAAILCSLALILQRQRVPGFLLWAALLPALSVGLDFRMLMVRSHVASVLLLLWILYLFERRSLRALLILLFIYTWTYTAPFFALTMCCAMAAGRWMIAALAPRSTNGDAESNQAADRTPDAEGESTTRPSDRTLVLGGIGATVAGLVIHPQTPNQILNDWLHLSLVATRAWGLSPSSFELGSELQSETLREAYSLHPGILFCLTLCWLVALLVPGVYRRRTLLFVWMTVPALALYGLSGRFIEYLAPLSVRALALVTTDARPALATIAAGLRRSSRLLLAGCGLTVVIALHSYSLRMIDRLVWHPEHRLTQELTGGWLAAHAKPGDLVVPLDWTQFPQLYYYAPRLRYVVGLEPTTMDVVYPEKLRYIEELRLGKRDLDMRELRQVFPDARYVVIWQSSGGAAARIAHTKYTPAFAESDALVFDVAACLARQDGVRGRSGSGE